MFNLEETGCYFWQLRAEVEVTFGSGSPQLDSKRLKNVSWSDLF